MHSIEATIMLGISCRRIAIAIMQIDNKILMLLNTSLGGQAFKPQPKSNHNHYFIKIVKIVALPTLHRCSITSLSCLEVRLSCGIGIIINNNNIMFL